MDSLLVTRNKVLLLNHFSCAQWCPFLLSIHTPSTMPLTDHNINKVAGPDWRSVRYVPLCSSVTFSGGPMWKAFIRTAQAFEPMASSPTFWNANHTTMVVTVLNKCCIVLWGWGTMRVRLGTNQNWTRLERSGSKWEVARHGTIGGNSLLPGEEWEIHQQIVNVVTMGCVMLVTACCLHDQFLVYCWPVSQQDMYCWLQQSACKISFSVVVTF